MLIEFRKDDPVVKFRELSDHLGEPRIYFIFFFKGVFMLRGSVPSTNSHALHTFSRAPQATIPRSKFNRSHGVKTTFNEGF